MGNRQPQPPKHRQPETDLVDEDPEDDDEEEDVDDNEIRDLEQERLQPSAGREWIEIASNNESITYVLPICRADNARCTKGCLVRVKYWGLRGEPLMTTNWLPEVTLADLETDPPPVTTRFMEALVEKAAQPDADPTTEEI